MDAKSYFALSGGEGSNRLDAAKGLVRYWNDPLRAPTKRANGQRGRENRRREPFDAVLETAFEDAAGRRAPRGPLRLAIPGLQLVVRHAIDRDDGAAAVAFGYEPGLFAVAAGGRADIAACDFLGVGAFCSIVLLDVAAATAMVRARAERHGIELPQRLAPPGRPRWAEEGFPDAPSPCAPGGILLRWAKPPEPGLSVVEMIGGFGRREADAA